ncbi:MAG: hypothetical protein AAGF78_02360 [Pseudomonadota bacterium]
MSAIPTDPDLWFVIGVVLAILCIPSLFSAWTDGRPPRASAITVLIAGGMIAYAVLTKPSGSSSTRSPPSSPRSWAATSCKLSQLPNGRSEPIYSNIAE